LAKAVKEMTIKHRIPCFDSEIIVKQAEDNETAFHVNIQSSKNPLGFGNTLGTFETEDLAVEMSERLCSFYSIAREHGYYLKSDVFMKPDEEEIPVSMVLDGSKTPDQIRSLIRQS
jgi:hypothetical protein